MGATEQQKMKTSYFGDWKQRFQEFEERLSLGKKEAADTFDNWKEQLMARIGELQKDIETFNEGGREKVRKTREKLDKLKVQLALGRAETREQYLEQREELEQQMDEVAHKLLELRQDAGEEFGEKMDSFRDKFQGARLELEILGLEYALKKEALSDKVQQRQEEFKRKVGEMRHSLEKKEEAGAEKWEDFREEMDKSVDHFRQAVKELFQ